MENIFLMNAIAVGVTIIVIALFAIALCLDD